MLHHLSKENDDSNYYHILLIISKRAPHRNTRRHMTIKYPVYLLKMIWRRGWRLILMILISIQILIYNHLGVQEGDPPKTSLLSRDFLAVESPAANTETDLTGYHVNQLRCAGIPQELINSSSIHSWRAELREAIAIPKVNAIHNDYYHQNIHFFNVFINASFHIFV